MGGVVKAYGRANLRVTTFLRDSRGLLVDRSDALVRARQTDVDLLPDLKAAIARAAAEGKPYTKTGGNGVYERRHELRRPSTSSAAPIGRVGGYLARPGGTGHGHGRRLEAGEVAGRARRPHGQWCGRLRHRAPEALDCGPAGSGMSIPGADLRSRLPASQPGTQGRAGTPNPALARDSSVPGQNRSRMRVGTRKPSNGVTFPVPGASSLKREGEHWECSPPSIAMAGRARDQCPNPMTRVLPGRNPIRGARARCPFTVRVQTEVCRVCGLHLPAVTHSKGEQGDPVVNGAMAEAVPPFPERSKDHSASDRYYPRLIASRSHIGEIEACAQ